VTNKKSTSKGFVEYKVAQRNMRAINLVRLNRSWIELPWARMSAHHSEWSCFCCQSELASGARSCLRRGCGAA
jgi:hypothetical protein